MALTKEQRLSLRAVDCQHDFEREQAVYLKYGGEDAYRCAQIARFAAAESLVALVEYKIHNTRTRGRSY